MTQKKIGGVSSRFGVGIIYGSRISFATRLKNGQIATFSEDTLNCSRWSKIPFLRSLLIFRQIILIFFLARKNLVRLAKDNLIDLHRWKRLRDGLLFLALYVGFFFFFEPILSEAVPILRWSILLVSMVILIRLFFHLVLGNKSLKYHGAEHKVINTFLAGDPLNIHAVQHHSRLALRCGTSLATFFIIAELFIPEHIYDFFIQTFGSTTGSFVIFFLILGLAYETLTIISQKESAKWLSWLTIPLCQTQLLTTREPSLRELEVALSAIREAVGWQPSRYNDEHGQGLFTRLNLSIW